MFCLFQIYLLCLEHEHIVSRSKITSVKVTFCEFFYNLFVLTTVDTPLRSVAQSCQFYDNVFEKDRKRLELRALWPPPSPEQACLFTPALLGIKLCEENNTCRHNLFR
jgi:hypothetical protein